MENKEWIKLIMNKKKLLNEYMEELDFKTFDKYMVMKGLYYCGFISEANLFNKNFNLDKEFFFKMVYLNIPESNKFIAFTKKGEKVNKSFIQYICEYYHISKNDAVKYDRFFSMKDRVELLKKFGLEEKEIDKIFNIKEEEDEE